MQPGSIDEPGWLKVVDPMAGTYYVPWAQIHQTSGTASVFSKPRDISLCLLYQKGSCNASTRCHQVHADTTFVASMRALHKHNNTCCPHHGDCLSNLDGLLDPLLSSESGVFLYGKKTANKGIEIPKRRIGRTIFLERLLNSNPPNKPLHIPVDKVCGLHQQHKCLYSHGCRNLHVCRDLWNELIAQHPWLTKEVREPRGGASKPGKRPADIPAAPAGISGWPPQMGHSQQWVDEGTAGLAQLQLNDEIYTLDVSAMGGRPPVVLNGGHPQPTQGPPRPAHPHVMAASTASDSHTATMQSLQRMVHMAPVAYAQQQELQQQQLLLHQQLQLQHQQLLPPPPQQQSQLPVKPRAAPTGGRHPMAPGSPGVRKGQSGEEDPTSDVISDSISSMVESYGHTDEAPDLVSDILDMPPNLIENLHQLIMEDNRGKSRAFGSLRSQNDLLQGLVQHALNKGLGTGYSAAPQAPQAPAPVAHAAAAAPVAPGLSTTRPKFMHMAQPTAPSAANNANSLIVLVPPADAAAAPSASYLLTVPLDGAGGQTNAVGNPMAMDSQAAQRLLHGNPVPVPRTPPPQPTGAFGFASSGVAPVAAAPAQPKVEAPGGVMKAMSHLTRAGFFGELQELIQWKEAGMLTEAEFTAVKARMLAEHNVTPS